MNLYYLHLEAAPAVPTEEIQIAFADVCAIAPDQATAEAWGRDLILSHSFLPGALLAAVEIRPGQTPDLDGLEVLLLAKAQQRSPQCALQMTVAGKERPDVEVRPMPLPERGRPN